MFRQHYIMSLWLFLDRLLAEYFVMWITLNYVIINFHIINNLTS